MEDTPRPFLDRPVFHALLLCVLALLAYSNTFHSPFLFDDRSSITENRVVRDIANYVSNSSGFRSHPTRFVGYLTFAVNYRFGGLDVTGFHAVNLAIHAANALLLYALVLLIFRTPRMRDSTLRDSPHRIALLVSALFVAHPVQTEAVTYIVQRLTSLATTFYLSSLSLYGCARLLLEKGNDSKEKALCLYALSLVAAVLAMHTKEISFTLPIAALLFDVSFFPKGPVKRGLLLVPMLLTLAVIPFHLFRVDGPLGEILSDVGRATTVQTDLSRTDYLTTQLCVIATYVRLLFLPLRQNLDYDYPVYTSILAPRPLFSLLLLLGLLGAAGAFFRRSRRKSSPDLLLPAFGITWFVLTLAVESSVIPIADVIYEHRMYLPSAGALIAVVSGAALIAHRFGAAKKGGVVAGVALACVAALSAATYARNAVYSDPVTFWGDVVRKSPGKARPYNNLGVELSAAGRPEEAIPVLTRAIQIEPRFVDAYNNLGAAFADAGRQEEGIDILRKTVLLQPKHPQSYYNLGRIHLLYTRRYDEAIRWLSEAVRLKPDYADAYVNLAAAYNRSGKFAESARISEAVMDTVDDRADAHFNLCVAYYSLGNREGALRELEIVRRLAPSMARALEGFMGAPQKME